MTSTEADFARSDLTLVSILRQGPYLIASIHTALDDTERLRSQHNPIAKLGEHRSRGLTLEGLTTSYFYRNSQAYDTLMQMGRWFGYRDGYEDHCRVWMSDEAHGNYEYIAGVIAELRDDLKRMKRQGLTPREFGLRVRSHPGALVVTVLAAIATPPFPSFFALLRIAQRSAFSVAAAALLIWLMWSWAGARLMLGFIAGTPSHDNVHDLARGKLLLYSGVLAAFSIAGIYAMRGGL